MNSNRCSCERGDQPTGSPPDRVAALAADLDGLATQDVDGLSDAALAEQALQLRRLLDRLEGPWLQRSPPSTPAGPPGPTTAPKPLHRQLAARSAPPGRQHRGQRRADRPSPVRRPLTETAQALCAGELSAAHTSALAHGTSDLPDHTTVKAEPVLAAAAHRLDPPRLRRAIGHLHQVADPDGADCDSERRHGRHGLWLAPTFEGMVALHGLLDPKPARPCWPPGALARPANDPRSSDQRRADA
jgi:hypothetical protein